MRAYELQSVWRELTAEAPKVELERRNLAEERTPTDSVEQKREENSNGEASKEIHIEEEIYIDCGDR